MTHKERFTAALKRQPITGLVPTFELVYFLTMEKFGKIHPSHRQYRQWDQMSKIEQNLHRNDVADLHIDTAREYNHDAIFIHPNPGTYDEIVRLLELIREKTGDEFFVMMHGDATYSIPDGNHMVEFSYKIADEPEKLKADAKKNVEIALGYSEKLVGKGLLDGLALCSDYCLNTGPFLSPNQFSEFVTPYLYDLVKGYRDRGYYTIKHTDGNIMPIIDQLVECKPDALHSLDPQAGVDIAKVKKMYGDQICLIGNVNCGLLETGTEQEAIDAVRYALQNGMPDYGYIFSTSNCVYTGMPIQRYELMMDIWKKEGIYK